jgi:hypothetical protein
VPTVWCFNKSFCDNLIYLKHFNSEINIVKCFYSWKVNSWQSNNESAKVHSFFSLSFCSLKLLLFNLNVRCWKAEKQGICIFVFVFVKWILFKFCVDIVVRIPQLQLFWNSRKTFKCVAVFVNFNYIFVILLSTSTVKHDDKNTMGTHQIRNFVITWIIYVNMDLGLTTFVRYHQNFSIIKFVLSEIFVKKK